MDQVHLISARERDLGGFFVRRVLPYARRRMVGPFIFFDHMGPAEFQKGTGMVVRPHPHIHLATVTYLFEGTIHHRDSLGSDQMIEPGAINWMTAGRGIVHSERTPPKMVATGSRVNGIQLWVALPAEKENSEPSFHHYPETELPEFFYEGAKLKLLIGNAFGKSSPVKILSDLFYLDANLNAGKTFTIPNTGRETAIYLVSGSLKADREVLAPYTMYVADDAAMTVTAQEDSRLMILGGKPLGERHIFWNFVSSREENIEQAKREWLAGPGSARFPKVPGDEKEFIPLPND